jgi:hypothetical protein
MDKVVSVTPLEKRLLEIVFADGFRKVIDIHPFIGRRISSALNDDSYFSQVALKDGGSIAWPNGYVKHKGGICNERRATINEQWQHP